MKSSNRGTRGTKVELVIHDGLDHGMLQDAVDVAFQIILGGDEHKNYHRDRVQSLEREIRRLQEKSQCLADAIAGVSELVSLTVGYLADAFHTIA